MTDLLKSTALAASRVRLNVFPNTLVPLDTLSDDAALELLTTQIAEAGAQPFPLDDCVDLCAMLDNYPKLACGVHLTRLDSVLMTESEPPSIEQIGTFLADHHGQPAQDLAPLDGGFWSTAYGYEVAGDAFVLRLSASGEGFEMDQAAHQFTTETLPIPEVLEVGEGLGRWFAISRRARGQFLENIAPDDASAAGPMVDRLLSSLRSARTEEQTVDWFSGRPGSWQGWLERLLVDDPSSTVSGWRAKVGADPQLDSLFRRAEARILELLDSCPERRDLLHGDLLHQNVLVSERASQVNAVFSWKCSVLGDHLYDVAWLSFWEPWHPGIQQLDAWTRTASQPIEGDDMHDAEIRHHCYELHIGVQHLAWCSWTGNAASLAGVALRTAHVLDRGARSMPEQLQQSQLT